MERQVKFSFDANGENSLPGSALTMPFDIAQSILSWLEISPESKLVEIDAELLKGKCLEGEERIEGLLRDVNRPGEYSQQRALNPLLEDPMRLGVVIRKWSYGLRALCIDALREGFTKITYEEIEGE